jgi:hypothetical protein
MSKRQSVGTRGTLSGTLGWKPESPDSAPTGLVRRVRALLEMPITELGAADVGFLLRQNIGVGILLDRALDLLESDPMMETEYYPGDLLCAALRVPPQYYAADDGRRARIMVIADEVSAVAGATTTPGRPYVAERLRAAIEADIKQLKGLLKSDNKN